MSEVREEDVTPPVSVSGTASSISIRALGPASLVLAALVIDVAAGRWGSYIRTPISGLYLADALFAAGSLWGISRLRTLRGLPRDVFVVFGLCLAYLVLRGVTALAGEGAADRYLILRDLAPFAFLALVPLAAAALTAVSLRVVLWVLRIATLAHVTVALLVAIDLVEPFGSSLLGNAEVLVLSARGDLFGVIAGLGFLSWGAWPGVMGGSRLIQVAIIAATVTTDSRAALVTFVFCVVADIWRERRWWAWWSWLGVAAAGVVLAAGALVLTGFVGTGDGTTTVAERDASDADPLQGSAITKFAESEAGTGRARLTTYSMVLEALGADGLWVAGDGPGTDILYEICTGLEDAPARPIVVGEDGERTKLPKCPVDSGLSTTLRDPHQWVLNSMIYHGVLGTIPLALALLWPLWRLRRTPNSSLSIIGVGAYLVCASFGVVLSSPFGSLPIAVLLAWLLASSAAARGLGSEPSPTTASRG